MPAIVARFILALAAVVVAPVLFTVLFILLDGLRWSDEVALSCAAVITAVLFIVAWILVWRSEVTWTKRRRLATLLSVFISTGIAFACGLVVTLMTRYGDVELGIIVGSLFWLPVWVAATAIIWREAPHERADRLAALSAGRLRCPTCGYDLTGLRESRCPECGTQYSLDQLLGALAESTHRLPSAEWANRPIETPWWRDWAKAPHPAHPWCMAGVTIVLLWISSAPSGLRTPLVQLAAVLMTMAAIGLTAVYVKHMAAIRAARRHEAYPKEEQRQVRWRWVSTPVCIVVLVSVLITPWPAGLRFISSKPAFDEALAQAKALGHGTLTPRRIGSFRVAAIRVRNDDSVFFELGDGSAWRLHGKRHGIIFAPTGNHRYGHYLAAAEGGGWWTARISR